MRPLKSGKKKNYQGYWGDECERNLFDIYNVKSEDTVTTLSESREIRIKKQYTKELKPPNYKDIKCPCLSLYAIYEPGKPLFGWENKVDLELQKKMRHWEQEVYPQFQRKNMQGFLNECKNSIAFEVPNTNHFLFLSAYSECMELIIKFLKIDKEIPQDK